MSLYLLLITQNAAFQWFLQNWLECFGVVSSLLYIYLEIKQRSSLWIVGIISSVVFVIVFYQREFYAFSALYIYYVVVSIYGIYCWHFAQKSNNNSITELPIKRLNLKLGIVLAAVSIVLFLSIGYVLDNFVETHYIPPYYEALATSLSFVATWMLAHKILEQWLLWIFVNFFSSVLYFWGGLYPTSGLFVVYGFMSIVGLYKWKQSFNKALKT